MMRSDNIQYPHTPQFQEICRLALKKDTRALTSFIAQNQVSIDLHLGLFDTPASALAAQGEHEAVDLLLQKFNANRDFAVYGYAKGYFPDKVEEYIKLGASCDYVALGYAVGRHKPGAYGDNLVKQVMDQHQASHEMAILGYALSSANERTHVAGVDSDCKQLITSSDYDYFNAYISKNHLQQCAALGLAIRGNIAHAISNAACSGNLNFALLGAAITGNSLLINKVIEASSSRYPFNNEYLIQGFAIGGFNQQIEDHLTRGNLKNNLNQAAFGFAKTGLIRWVNHYVNQGADRAYAARGYAEGGHYHLAEEEVKKGAELNNMLRGYVEGRHKEKLRGYLQTEHKRLASLMYYYAMFGCEEAVKILRQIGVDKMIAVRGFALIGKELGWWQMCGDSPENYKNWVNERTRGYAEAGNIAQVNYILKEPHPRKGDKNFAVEGYAFGGFVNQVNELIAQGANIEQAIHGYMREDQIIADAIYNVNLLYAKYKEHYEKADLQSVLTKAQKVKSLTMSTGINHQQALSLLFIKNLRVWFLQGKQLVEQAGLPLEIFLHISTYVCGIDLNNTINLFNRYLFNFTKQVLKNQVEKINLASNSMFKVKAQQLLSICDKAQERFILNEHLHQLEKDEFYESYVKNSHNRIN